MIGTLLQDKKLNIEQFCNKIQNIIFEGAKQFCDNLTVNKY